MKIFQFIGVMVLLVSGVLATANASAAVTFLLAEWLVNGTVATTELAATGTTGPGELLLEDTALKADILCSGVGVGWVGPNSLYFVSEVLTLEGVAIGTPLSGTGMKCVSQTTCASSPTPVIWPVGLPYEGEVELMEDEGHTFFVALLTTHGGGAPGWEIECTVLGVKTTDECTSPNSVAELSLEGTTLLVKDSEAFTLLAEGRLGMCTFAGGETGILEGEGAIALSGGGELTASSEGVVS